MFKRLSQNNQNPDGFICAETNPIVQGLNGLCWMADTQFHDWINKLVAPHSLFEVRQLQGRRMSVDAAASRTEEEAVKSYLQHQKSSQYRTSLAYGKIRVNILTYQLRHLPEWKRKKVVDWIEQGLQSDTLTQRIVDALTVRLDSKKKNTSTSVQKFDDTAPFFMAVSTPEKAAQFQQNVAQACQMLCKMSESELKRWTIRLMYPPTLSEMTCHFVRKHVFNAAHFVSKFWNHLTERGSR